MAGLWSPIWKCQQKREKRKIAYTIQIAPIVDNFISIYKLFLFHCLPLFIYLFKTLKRSVILNVFRNFGSVCQMRLQQMLLFNQFTFPVTTMITH